MRLLYVLFLACLATAVWADCRLEWSAPTTDILGNPIDPDTLLFRVYVVPIGDLFVPGQFVAETPDEMIECGDVGMVPGQQAQVTAFSLPYSTESPGSNVVDFTVPEVTAPTAFQVLPPPPPDRLGQYSVCTLTWVNPPEDSLSHVELFLSLAPGQFALALPPWLTIGPATPGAAEVVPCSFPSFTTWYMVVRAVNTAGIPGPISVQLALRWSKSRQ